MGEGEGVAHEAPHPKGGLREGLNHLAEREAHVACDLDERGVVGLGSRGVIAEHKLKPRREGAHLVGELLTRCEGVVELKGELKAHLLARVETRHNPAHALRCHLTATGIAHRHPARQEVGEGEAIEGLLSGVGGGDLVAHYGAWRRKGLAEHALGEGELRGSLNLKRGGVAWLWGAWVIAQELNQLTLTVGLGGEASLVGHERGGERLGGEG